ncbi:MAG: flagellar FliJ family protein [Acidimicrobiales bacterium]
MAKRRDPIKAVLRLRGIREKQHMAEVAKVNQKISDARERIQERRVEYQERPKPGPVVDPARLRALQLSGIRSNELLEMAIEELVKTEHELTEARQRWADASAKRKSAERLSDKRNSDAAAAAIRAGQQSLDDLVVTMWRRHPSQGLSR